MDFFRRLINNTGTLLSAVGKHTQLSGKDDDSISISGVSFSQDELDGKQAIFPQWFFSARLGQPRQVDTQKIRTYAKSVWVQMVLNTFKKQIYSLDWEIVPIDDKDETDYSEKIKIVTDFLNNINKNGDMVNDLDSEIITDLGEIDAATYNYVFSGDSYDIGPVPIYDYAGNITAYETGLVLKEFGKRTLTQVKTADGGSFLKQIDIHKDLLRYYQYSFKHPRQNPTSFDKAEISYLMLNRKSYSVYGYSPVQALQQVLELLIQGTRYNKDIFKNNAIPDLLVSIPKLSVDNLAKLKRLWNNEYKGKPHQIGFINFPIENVHKLAESNRDLEWLDGQKWYFKLVFAVFGVSPTEAGFFENSNKGNDEGQERVTVRNALRPYLKPMERDHTTRMIPEILQEEKPGIMFRYKLVDSVKEKTEFDQNVKEMELGSMTINEFRKMKGKDPVDWGDEPIKQSNPFGDNMFGDNNKDNPNQNGDDKQNKYKKSFERFLNDK